MKTGQNQRSPSLLKAYTLAVAPKGKATEAVAEEDQPQDLVKGLLTSSLHCVPFWGLNQLHSKDPIR